MGRYTPHPHFVPVLGILCIFILISAGNAVAWESGYDYRKSVTVDHVNSSGDTMINYPAMINVSKEPAMQADYDDVRFVAADDTEMSFELEKAYPDYAIYWVNITSLPSSGSTFWMYYGNDTVSSGSDPEAVWSSDYAMVQHLQESPANGVAGHLDSTGNNNDGTPYGFDGVAGSTTDAEGMVDGADEFDGVDDYVNCGNAASLDLTDAMTLSAWVFINSMPNDSGIVSKWAPGGVSYFLTADTGNQYKLSTYDGVNYVSAKSVVNSVVVGIWQHVVGTYDGANLQIYVNGIANGAAEPSNNIDIGNSDVVVGCSYPTNEHLIGSIDQVRILNKATSHDQIKQDYEMVVNQSAIVSFGGSEDALHPFVSGANKFYAEMTDGLTNFRNDMGRYLIWAVIFFGISISFALMAKIKQTLIGGK